jgi:hypothetical protein
VEALLSTYIPSNVPVKGVPRLAGGGEGFLTGRSLTDAMCNPILRRALRKAMVVWEHPLIRAGQSKRENNPGGSIQYPILDRKF